MFFSGKLGRALAGCALLGCATAGAETPVLYYGHTGEVAEFNAKDFTDFGGTPTETHVTGGITFRLFYEDVRLDNNIGFDGPSAAAARQRVRDVLDYIASVLNVTGTLDVHWQASETDGSGFLAACGSFYSLGNGIQQPSTLRRIANGSKPFANTPEIQGTVDFGFNYNFTSAPTTGGQVDFFSVMLHEFTHALGIAALTRADGLSAFAGNGAPNARTQFDRSLVKGQGGTSIINASGLFTGNVSDLTSNDLFSNGAQATSLYDQGGTQPGIYAPTSFATGSSLSHWNTGNIVGSAVMEHAIPSNTDRREYAGVDLGGLIDIGWTDAADPNATEGEGEGVAEGEGEGQEGPVTLTVTNSGGTYVEEGGTISLSVAVEGGTPTSFQWTKNNANIPSANSASFVKNNVSAADGGSYRVRVETGAKAVTVSDPVAIFVVPVGGLPVAGGLGLSAIAGACALAGALLIRKRK